MLTIALTGGLASGKTTVTDTLRTWGVPIIDADDIARQMRLSPPIAQAIKAHFHTEDRKIIQQIIFKQPAEKRWLEALLHPPIIQTIQSKIKALDPNIPYCMVSIPLLIELREQQRYQELFDLIDRIVVIDIDPTLQRLRAQQRDPTLDPNTLEQLIQTQVSPDIRRSYADDIVMNNGSREALLNNIRTLHERYTPLKRER
jgi:dephospho-CoA kinase